LPPKESNDRYLVISLSARALAGSLSAAGYSVAAIDLYCDRDVVKNLCQRVSVFDSENLLAAIHKINKKTSSHYLIYGGGLESCPELLDRLPENLILLGNSSDILRSSNNPETFFKLLDRLNIPYPEITFSSPKTELNWLVKPIGCCGGAGISFYNPTSNYSPNYYYQKYISGQTCSVIFVANGQQTRIIGYNEIWTQSDSSFVFAGAITLTDFPKHQDKIIKHVVQSLTIELELKGLCGLDFIIDDQEKIHVLEINPRPTATFELHEENMGDLIKQHVNACLFGELLHDRQNRSVRTRAKQIFSSEKTLIIDQEMKWPGWSADLPAAGEIINAHEPVCAIYADGKSVNETKESLKERKSLLKEILI